MSRFQQIQSRKLTPAKLREAVKTMTLGRTDPRSILSRLPRELVKTIMQEYAQLPPGLYSSYDEAIKHPMIGGPKPRNCFIAIGQSAASLRDTDWRGFSQMVLADDDVIYVKFLQNPAPGSTGPINTFPRGQTLRINWSANDANVGSAYYFNNIPGLESGFQVEFEGKNDHYFFGLLHNVAKEWLDFSPVARANDELRPSLEIPEDALSNPVIYKREYERALNDTHASAELVGFTCNDPLVQGLVMANHAQESHDALNDNTFHHFLLQVQKGQQLIHPGILRLYGFTTFTKGPFVSYEFKSGTNVENIDPWLIQERVNGPNGGPPVSLGDYISKIWKGPLPIDLQVKIARSIASALAYLHRYMVHRVINSNNVLLVFGNDGRPTGEVKIYNYEKYEYVPRNSAHANAPSPNLIYDAPEAREYSTLHNYYGGRDKTRYVKGSDREKKIDVYSFGLLLWEMATGLKPFSTGPTASMRRSDLDRLIRTLPYGSERWNPVARPPLVGNAAETSPFRDIIDLAWSHDPDNRPSSAMLVGLLSYLFDV